MKYIGSGFEMSIDKILLVVRGVQTVQFNQFWTELNQFDLNGSVISVYWIGSVGFSKSNNKFGSVWF